MTVQIYDQSKEIDRLELSDWKYRALCATLQCQQFVINYEDSVRRRYQMEQEAAMRMSMMISFQMIPVVCQSEVTDSIKSLFCLIGISNHQTSALQCLNLLCQRHRLFSISHAYIQKMSRWVRCSYGKRAGFVVAKIGIFRLSSKLFPEYLQIFCFAVHLFPKSFVSLPFERWR